MVEDICWQERSQREAKMKDVKSHQPSFYTDKKDGFMYCGLCEKSYEGSGWPREMARLVESKRYYLSNNMSYPSNRAKPLRHNQKITNEHLEQEFDKVEGEYLKIEDLKIVWGPSYINPDGFIDVNNTDKSTTVVSSSYLRRLGKITGFKWTQQRADGEDGEKLIVFRQTKEAWVHPRKVVEEKRLEKLRIYELKEKIRNSIQNLNEKLEYAQKSSIDDETKVKPTFENADMKDAYIENIEKEIEYLELILSDRRE